MTTFHQGELICVPCEIRSGPFPHEKLIQVDTTDGPFLGFADACNLQMRDAESGYLKGKVVSEEGESVAVILFGSFFRTAMGLASMSRSVVLRLADLR